MVAATARGHCVAICCALAGLSAQAANRCVDAKGRTQPLAACASAEPRPPLATPGTYSTLPQRSPPTRGPQPKVFASNPHPTVGARPAPPGDGPAQVVMPLVIERHGAPGVAGAGTNATNAISIGKWSARRQATTSSRVP